MEGLPQAPRPARLPGKGRVPGLERRGWQHSGKRQSAVARRARSHDASRSYKVGRTALHKRVPQRKARAWPQQLDSKAAPKHVP